ncbi:MAG: hypothetical protein K9L69_04160, partial [Candidatus Omnitrophica bacterium]|nr:hypothetical protein [Candidatus Omnitrophota bacterium]
MMKFKVLIVIFTGVIINLNIISFAQVNQEKEEVKMERAEEETYAFAPDVSQKVTIFSGYDTNVKLSNQRTGDIFEEFLYSFDYNQKLSTDLEFKLDYDFDFINYNEVTDISSLLNHLRLELN